MWNIKRRALTGVHVLIIFVYCFLGEELYTIESLLGQGGFAQVFKAGMLDALDMTDLEGGEQKYALKVKKGY